jgi:predicted negative regulator of RcsB-dependent stress response
VVSTGLAATGDDLAAQALLHRSLAGACYFLADPDRGLSYLQHARAPHHTAEVLVSIGDFHSANGDPALAGQAWSEALAELAGTDSPMARRIRDRLLWHR